MYNNKSIYTEICMHMTLTARWKLDVQTKTLVSYMGHPTLLSISKEGWIMYETIARMFKLIMIKYILLYFNLLWYHQMKKINIGNYISYRYS